MATTLPESQQLAEAGDAAAVLQEVVSAQLLGSSTAFDVNAQADTQERLELLGKLLGLLQPGSTVGSDEVERLEGLFVEVGWL